MIGTNTLISTDTFIGTESDIGVGFNAVLGDDTDIDTVVYNMFTIDQVMKKKIVSVSPSSSIKEVAEILAQKEFHALPVVNNNQLIGIVTTTDLINYLLKQF